AFRLIIFLQDSFSGVWSGYWSVIFENQCALKGTSVVIKCSYDYPSDHTVTSRWWSKAQYIFGAWSLVPLSRLHTPPDFRYVGDDHGNCDLEINNVRHADEGAYFFSFVTTRNRWTSRNFAELSVKELTAVVQPSTVTEGDHVSLSCVSGCSTPTTIVWFRDGQLVPKPVFRARREDAGRYYCAVLRQETVTSNLVALNVQYPPQVAQSSGVNLTCSSVANPAAVNYTWYKKTDYSSSMLQVGSGQVLTILSVEASHTGLYLCQARNSVGENNSTEVLLTMTSEEQGLCHFLQLWRLIIISNRGVFKVAQSRRASASTYSNLTGLCVPLQLSFPCCNCRKSRNMAAVISCPGHFVNPW
uniref:Ig-like domain-containing protein n=1 Tax=Seriola lalandi dorsalis TaxID=1841481 RepID=A0A3B4XMH3_SERLL